MWYKTSSILESAGLVWCLLLPMERVNSAQKSPDLSSGGSCFSWLEREPLITVLMGYHLQSKQTLQHLCRSLLLFQLALNLTPKPKPTPNSKHIPLATMRISYKTRHILCSHHPLQAAKLFEEQWGSHTFLLLPSLVLQKELCHG